MSRCNYKLLVAYDGTGYKGWQRTEAGPSIEEYLQKAIETVFQHPVKLQAASRTDAGVHAEGQVVNFISPKEIHSLKQLPVRLNRLLPKDITVLCFMEADFHFHPTTSAKGKIYHYHLCLSPIQSPHRRLYSWHCYSPLNLALMRQAAEQLQGTRDYSAFCNFHTNSRYQHFEREVLRIEIVETGENQLCIVVEGRSFLYKMVRNLVGTIVNIGQEKIAIEQLETIIAGKDRRCAGPSAPAHGLFLKEVYY